MPHFDRVRARWLPLWMLGAMVALYAVAETRAPGWMETEAGDLAFMYALYAVIGVWAAYACRRAGVTLRAMVGARPPAGREWRALALVPANIALTIGAIYLLWWPLSHVAPGLTESWLLEDEPPTWVAAAPLRSVLAVLLVVVVGPVVEELLFRGVLLHRWACRWSAGTAVIVSAVAFGVGHADVIGATAFGVVMAMLYVRTGSLWVPIACHVANNASAVLAELLDVGDVPIDTVAELQATWYVGVIALVLAAVALYLMRGLYLPPPGWRLPALAGAHGLPAAGHG